MKFFIYLLNGVKRRLFSRFEKAARYDVQTLKIIKKVTRINSNTVDVGAHVGVVLKNLVRNAPQGTHYAFEPLPDCFEKMTKEFQGCPNVKLFNCALGDIEGTVSFQQVSSNPGFSGLRLRNFGRPETVKEIQVNVKTLDSLIPESVKIDFIKIDVEGAELGVLRGGSKTIHRCKPVIVFEHGVGGADYFGTTPEMIFDFCSAHGLNLSIMSSFLRHNNPFSKIDFVKEFSEKKNYYFVAYPTPESRGRVDAQSE